MLKKDKTRRRTGPSTPTGMDVTSERELLLMGENYRLKDKIDRVIEHAEETISELQVEINSTKQYYIEREEKLQAITDGVQAELREQQNVTEKLTLELDQERLKLSKAAHFIEVQQKAGLLKSTEGLGTSEAQSSHYKDVVLSELMGDAEGLDPQDHEHHHGPSPMSSPLKVTATSPLRIDIAELRSTTDSRLEKSPFRLSSEGGNSANSSRSGVSQAYYQSEISKLEADLEKAKKEAVSAYGLIEQLANSDEILAKYEASRSRERQLLKHIKASTPMKKSQLFKKNSRGRAGESTSPDGAPSLHAVHHAGKVKFGKSRGLKLLPRDLGSRVATKSQREERKRRTGNHWGKTDVLYTAPESDDGRVSEAHGGTSPGSDGSDEGAASTLISDDDMITTREAISRCEDSLILDVGCSLPASNEVTSGEYRHQWRNYFRQQVFPRLEEFAPDMIFISAGFDAHKKDGINSGYIALVEEDFDWVTNGLIRIANSCCEGRVVSALEGGYQIGGEFCSSFAKSVKTHVASLAAGAKTVMPYSVEDGVREMEVEKALLDEAAERRYQKQLQLQRQEELAREARRLAEEAARAAAEQQGEGENAAAMNENEGSGNVTTDTTAGAAPAEHYAGNGDDEGNGRKRRRAAANVDYVALDKELKAKGEGAPLAE